MKFWIGGAAKSATICAIWAQLFIDGKHFGVHSFIARIRDENHNVLSGLTIGDCGQKMGAHGIDNGFIVFENFKIPLDSLLDRFCSVSPEGVYSSPMKSKTLFSLSLASLG